MEWPNVEDRVSALSDDWKVSSSRLLVIHEKGLVLVVAQIIVDVYEALLSRLRHHQPHFVPFRLFKQQLVVDSILAMVDVAFDWGFRLVVD